MKTKKRILILLAGMLILTLFAAGCGSSKKHKGPPDGDYSSRGYLLILDRGHYKIRDYEEGSYTIDGDKITLSIENWPAADNDCSQTVFTYQWSFDAEANLLSFKAVDDTCSSRVYGFSLGRWEYNKISK